MLGFKEEWKCCNSYSLKSNNYTYYHVHEISLHTGSMFWKTLAFLIFFANVCSCKSFSSANIKWMKEFAPWAHFMKKFRQSVLIIHFLRHVPITIPIQIPNRTFCLFLSIQTKRGAFGAQKYTLMGSLQWT